MLYVHIRIMFKEENSVAKFGDIFRTISARYKALKDGEQERYKHEMTTYSDRKQAHHRVIEMCISPTSNALSKLIPISLFSPCNPDIRNIAVFVDDTKTRGTLLLDRPVNPQ